MEVLKFEIKQKKITHQNNVKDFSIKHSLFIQFNYLYLEENKVRANLLMKINETARTYDELE